MRRFATTAVLFCAGLVFVLAAAESAAARFMRPRWQLGVAAEVYAAESLASARNPSTRVAYLGDSVARQLFPHGSEPGDTVLYLPTNQAIAAAGQFYLLRDLIATHPNLRGVVLMINPLAWANNLNQIYTHDYFCGPFHRPDQIRDVFAVTRNWGLLFTHLGRALLPNLNAANTFLSMDEVRRAPIVRPESGHVVSIVVADVSLEYLRRMHDLASRTGVRLQVLPTPVSDEFTYSDDLGVYDGPIVYLPHHAFVEDGVHLKRPEIPAARAIVATRLGLDRPAPVEARDRGPEVIPVSNAR